jgi:hypothetical protein
VLLGNARTRPHGAELWLPVMALLAGSADGITLAAHVRGLWGDPSITSLVILFLFTLQPSWLPPVPRAGSCLVLVALVAVPLYAPLFIPIPTVQGGFYALGFEPTRLLGLIGMAATGLWIARKLDPRWTTIVALGLFAYAGRLMESDNLFDYLVDPGLMLAMAFLGFTGICTSLHRRLKGI